MSLEQLAVKRFFSSGYFAVAGASSDPAKFGHKVFVWYLNHSLPVTPLNPSQSSITCPHFSSSAAYPTLPSPKSLPNPTQTSLSIITPPKITLRLLEEAKAVKIASIFLQPGTYDSEVVRVLEEDAYWNEGGRRWVGPGSEGGNGREGWCVLVDGENGLKMAGKGEAAGKL